MVQLYAHSSTQSVARARDQVGSACGDIRAAWRYYGSGWTGPATAAADTSFRDDLRAVLATGLDGDIGITAGVWQPERGLLASLPADPSHLPPTPTWRATAAAAAERDEDTVGQATDHGDPIVVAACRLGGPVPGLVAWAARRLHSDSGLTEMRLGLVVLLALVAGMTGVLSWLIASWSRHVGRIETTLAGYAAGRDHALPLLPATGEWELDRIVAALNMASARLDEAQRDSAALAVRMAAAERLAALGRVAAGMAHEIRNPIAAMRLRAENALAGDDQRRRAALGSILEQVARLDRLITELLAMTQGRAPDRVALDLAGFLADIVRDYEPAATRRQVTLSLEAPAGTMVHLDPAMIGRAVSNLVQNAIEAAQAGGHVVVVGDAADNIRLSVMDDGPGVGGGVRARLFEPFVTGRAEGIGLGLAIARELVTSHGGVLELRDSDAGARFVIDLPGERGCR